MRKTDTLIKAISILALFAIACYIGYYLIESKLNPMRTAAAAAYTIEDSANTDGYAVRTEKILNSGSARISLTATEGEKLSSGSAYAMEYDSQFARDEAEEIQELKQKLQWLKALSENGSSAADEITKESVGTLAYSLDTGDMSQLAVNVSDVRTKLMEEGDYSANYINAQLESCQIQLNKLENELDKDVKWIRVDEAGLFSQYTDGYEDITAEQLTGITPDELTELFSGDKKEEDGTAGKLVTGIRWRYAAVMIAKDSEKLTEGSNVTIEFSKAYNASVKMKVESIGEAVNGRCVVIFVSDRNLADTLAIRELSGKVIFSSVKGIRIPREAIRMDEEQQKFIYIISGVQAQRVDVEILSEYDDYYIVEASMGNNLREGMEIIVEANELYDGKVVR